MFQLTTSRRGRLRSYYLLANLQCFNSRPHEEVDIPPKNNVRCPFCFNSRPHEEVDTNDRRYPRIQGRFNSRPHEEVDAEKIHSPFIQIVSTHDLTKRSTAIFTQKVFLSKSLFVLIAYNIFILH